MRVIVVIALAALMQSIAVFGSEPSRPSNAVHPSAAVMADSLDASSVPLFDGPPVTVDLLFVYTTTAARGAGGEDAVRAAIDIAVEDTNDALVRSLVPHRFRVVLAALTPYEDSGNKQVDSDRLGNPRDGFMDEVFALRESVQADLVVLVIEHTVYDPAFASLMFTFNTVTPYSDLVPHVTAAREHLNYVLPHELGHTMGIVHDHDTSPESNWLFPYGYGYRVPGMFSTIMAYPNCSTPCPRIPYYSNPSVLYNGVPTGVAGFADEALTLTQTMPVAASYRGCAIRLAPSVLRRRVAVGASTLAFDVTADSNCAWYAEQPGAHGRPGWGGEWVTRTSDAYGRGPGRVTYDISANTTCQTRSVLATIGNIKVAIEQDRGYSIDAQDSLFVPHGGGALSIGIDAVQGCAWRVDAPAQNWLSPVSVTGAGPGNAGLMAAPSASFSPQRTLLSVYFNNSYVRQIEVVQGGMTCDEAVAVSPARFSVPVGGGSFTLDVLTSAACFQDVYAYPTAWVGLTGQRPRSGGALIDFTVPANSGAPRFGFISVGGRFVSIRQPGLDCGTLNPPTVLPQSGGTYVLPMAAPANGCVSIGSDDQWTQVALVGGPGSTLDLQLKVASNEGTDSRVVTFTVNGTIYTLTQYGLAHNVTTYFSEGATGRFFTTGFAFLNPGEESVEARLAFQRSDGIVLTRTVAVPAHRRVTVTPESVSGLESAAFSTSIQASGRLVVDRTMTWGGGYGSHAETSVSAPGLRWYLAEGATHSGFDLFYLIQNPATHEANVHVRYLLPSGAPIEKDYVVAPQSRFNIWVDADDPLLASTDVSAVIDSDTPVIVERAMYLSSEGRLFNAGHESAGVTAPATEWFLAEGATGSFFDLFVLVANPNTTDAAIRATFLLPDGTSLVKTYTVSGNSRFNIWVDTEDERLADTAVSTIITSTNDVPIIVERAMWWPGPTSATWAEAHNSAGLTATGRTFAVADGEVGGARGTETYILIANRGAADTARITLHYEDGTSEQRLITLPASSRTNLAVASAFPGAAGRRFGAIVEALGANPQIAVERAMYSNAQGVTWAAGTNAVATKLQ